MSFQCPETIACYYRKDGVCTFWECAEKMPDAWKKVFKDEPDDDDALRYIDTFREPCTWEIEERQQSCHKFRATNDKKWLDCEECGEDLCGYSHQAIYVRREE